MSGPFGSTAWMANPSTGGFYNFPISNSIRLSETGYFTHTNDSDSDSRTKFTYSTWVKLTSTSTAHHQLFATTNDYGHIYFTADDNSGHTLRVLVGHAGTGGQNFADIIPTAKFRDYLAWYHIVVAVDTTQGTASNRIKIYINGVLQTDFYRTNTTYINQNQATRVGGTDLNYIGAQAGVDTYHKGYLAETHYIDNSQLTAASFGETKNNIWIPKDTAGLTYGTNGYRLQYKQTGTSANSSGMGADTSGNDNHWTPVNLVASDVFSDSPTNNFATLNPIATTSAFTIAEGSLKATQSANHGIIKSTISQSTGKWYCEIGIISGSSRMVGVALDTSLVTQNYIGHAADGYGYYSSGQKYSNNSASSYGASYANGDVIGIALDMDGGTVTFYKNNSSQGAAFSSLSGSFVFAVGDDGGSVYVANFGQDSSFAGNETAQGNADGNGIGDFYYAPPSGHLALCTANLPDPVATIDPNKSGSPQDYFSADIFTGNGTNQDIDIGFVPNLVWTKQRTDNSGGLWMDSVRGTDAYFQTANNNAEGDFGNITFTSTGYNVSGNSNVDNENAHKFIGWAWKAESAFSNDASSTSVGSIDSTGRVNADAGFSIVTYTGNGTAGASVAHGLGSEPKWIIAKRRNASGHWRVQHGALTYARYMNLDTTGGTGGDEPGVWHRAPTTTVFSLGQDGPNVNNGLYIAYSFAEVDGFSRFPDYIGNGSTDGPFIYCGFRPAFTIIKREDTNSRSWIIQDSARSPTNPIIIESEADVAGRDYESNATGGYNIDYLSNGIKIRNTNVNWNADGGRYIVMAFAEQPFKYANAR